MASKRDRDTARRYDKSLLAHSIGIYRTDAAWNLSYASEGILNFTGLTAETARGHGWLDCLHPEDRGKVEHAMARAGERGEVSVAAEYRMRTHDGTLRRVHVETVADHDLDGRVFGYLGVVFDIAERERLDAELQKSEKRFEMLAKVAPVAIYTCDSEGRMLFCNERWSELTGVPIGDALGRVNFKIVHPDDRDRCMQQAVQFLETERAARRAGGEAAAASRMERKYRVLHRDGRVLWILDHCVPDYDDTGKVSGFLGTMTDITEMTLATDRIRRMHGELEERVKQRTAELEAANNELEAFCYSVSHDLRAPLRSVEGFSLALLECEDSSLGPAGLSSLERVRDAGRRMGKLIDALLALSRLSRTELRREEVDLSELAAAAAEELLAGLPRAQAEIVIAPGVKAFGDAGLLRSVLGNLIGNALKFTHGGSGARIEFGAEGARDGEGETVYFVSDNGVGFNMDYSGKLFQAFERLHKESEFEGFGVGLATVARIVERHGGKVWARGAVGKGATFYFTLAAP